jgi:4-hydroxy-3-methylbut-2-en-1-yl diphosphate reductase
VAYSEPGQSTPSKPLIFRKGLDMKEAVAGELAAAYHSSIVDTVRGDDYRYQSGRLTVHLAREFGFCYGVDRAVDYAYQARRRFPGRNVFLTGEIIHNPHVNDRLRAAGIRFLTDHGERSDTLGPPDVVILPAFGVTVADMARLSDQGCTLVDTTCGSVLNVWKNVVRYAQDGFTAVIHGKVKHEETRATASQALKYPRGRYIVVLDREEAASVCAYIRHGGDPQAFLAQFKDAVSPGFDPQADLVSIGCANQTTMLMSESLEIGELFRAAMLDRYGEEALPRHFRAFDTICSATQERQDAIVELLDTHPLDLMLVVGGYNSSNTCNLARICAAKVRTFHIADPDCLLSASEIRYRPVGAPSTTVSREEIARDWLPASGAVTVGLTAGASTPNNIVGQVIERLERFATRDER